MILFVLLIGIPLLFFAETLMMMWFTWALHDVGYVSHALSMGDSATLVLPLFVATALGLLLGGSS